MVQQSKAPIELNYRKIYNIAPYIKAKIYGVDPTSHDHLAFTMAIPVKIVKLRLYTLFYSFVDDRTIFRDTFGNRIRKNTDVGGGIKLLIRTGKNVLL